MSAPHVPVLVDAFVWPQAIPLPGTRVLALNSIAIGKHYIAVGKGGGDGDDCRLWRVAKRIGPADAKTPHYIGGWFKRLRPAIIRAQMLDAGIKP